MLSIFNEFIILKKNPIPFHIQLCQKLVQKLVQEEFVDVTYILNIQIIDYLFIKEDKDASHFLAIFNRFIC